jgi:hypothetical protein
MQKISLNMKKLIPPDIRKLLLSIIVFVFDNLPNILLRIYLDYFVSDIGPYTKKILSKVSINKLIKSDCNSIRHYHILTNVESSAYKVKLIDEERYERVRTPDIYEVSKDNFVTLRKHEIAIYCFPNARFRAQSDILKIGDSVFWEKANRPEFAQITPLDDDFISIDKLSRHVLAVEGKKIRHFKYGYSLCGVHTSAWAHFIISYLPKLVALDELDFDFKLSLFVPSSMLENSKDLISFLLSNSSAKRKIEIIYVEDDEVIECSNLYYCNAIGYLGDHSTYVHPTSCCISAYGAKAVQKVSKLLWSTVKISKPRKLYIGRGAGRNLYNAKEVEMYFIENGFEIIHPHLMTLAEKINTFGNATHICGAVSSGFANMIFCKNTVKILGFFNFARCFDPFLSGLIFEGGFNHDLLFITGHEEVNTDPNNSYLIELDKIISCCEKTKFLQ